MFNSDLYTNVSWGGTPLNMSAIASPCGYAARAFFNDTFALLYANGTQISINENGISWPKDQGKKFKQGPDSSTNQWIDP